VIGPTCWNQWSAASQTADDAECRRSTHHKHQEVPADNTRPALVVSPSEDRAEDSSARLQVCPRSGIIIPGGVLPCVV